MMHRKFNAVCLEAVVSDASAGAGGAAVPAPAPKKERVVEKVLFIEPDGSTREVEFVGRQRMIKETFLKRAADGSVESLVVRFDFKSGRTLTFDVLASGLVFELAGHGAEQKIGDETAGETDIDDMYEAVKDIIERLSKGEFYAPRGEGFSGVSALARAVHEYQTSQGKVKTLEEVVTWVKGLKNDQRLALKIHPPVKAILDRFEAEKAAKTAKVDGDALLAGM